MKKKIMRMVSNLIINRSKNAMEIPSTRGYYQPDARRLKETVQKESTKWQNNKHLTKMFGIISFCMAVGISLAVPVYAAKDPDEGDYEVYVTEDGTKVYYDNYAIDGGIHPEVEPLVNASGKGQMAICNEIQSYPENVILSVPFQAQQNWYYCGPASARMLLATIGYWYTQDQLASMLGTTSTYGTSGGPGFANVLNTIVSGSIYGFTWQWHNADNISTIKGHIVEALAYGNPVIVNTWEITGQEYLVGHDIGVDLYHYGVVGDYFNYGASVTYVDPGYGVIPGFVLEQQVTITNMSYACGGRGYIW